MYYNSSHYKHRRFTSLYGSGFFGILELSKNIWPSSFMMTIFWYFIIQSNKEPISHYFYHKGFQLHSTSIWLVLLLQKDPRFPLSLFFSAGNQSMWKKHSLKWFFRGKVNKLSICLNYREMRSKANIRII